MSKRESKMMSPEEELVDILLDFIIVSANLAKKLNHAIRQKHITEGGNGNGKIQRVGDGHQRPAQRSDRNNRGSKRPTGDVQHGKD